MRSRPGRAAPATKAARSSPAGIVSCHRKVLKRSHAGPLNTPIAASARHRANRRRGQRLQLGLSPAFQAYRGVMAIRLGFCYPSMAYLPQYESSAHSARIFAVAPALRWCIPLGRGPRRAGGAHARPRLAGAEGRRGGGAGARADQGPRLPAARGARLPRCAGSARGACRAGARPRRFARRCRSRSSTRSTRRPPSSCAARRAARSTASRSRPNGRRRDAAAAGATGRPSRAAASRFRSGGASSRARVSSPASRSRSASLSSRALEAEGFRGVALKWPNDLVHRHLKVGGILIE